MTRAAFDALGWTRDAVQARIIGRLFSQRVQGLALKGGMAMRVAHYAVARATKDIDLDADFNMPLSSLQGLMRRAIHSATADGILKDVVVTEPKQTDTTARWKVAGKDPRTGQVLNLTVEVSRRDHVSAEEIREVPGGPEDDDMITVYRDEVLAFKKMKALFADNREAPRDIADLYLLISAHVSPPIQQIKEFLSQGGTMDVKQMWAKLDRMDKAMFKAEVLPSLPPTTEGQILYQDWEDIRLTVGEHLEHWIALASENENPAPVGNTACVHPSLTERLRSGNTITTKRLGSHL